MHYCIYCLLLCLPLRFASESERHNSVSLFSSSNRSLSELYEPSGFLSLKYQLSSIPSSSSCSAGFADTVAAAAISCGLAGAVFGSSGKLLASRTNPGFGLSLGAKLVNNGDC